MLDPDTDHLVAIVMMYRALTKCESEPQVTKDLMQSQEISKTESELEGAELQRLFDRHSQGLDTSDCLSSQLNGCRSSEGWPTGRYRCKKQPESAMLCFRRSNLFM